MKLLAEWEAIGSLYEVKVLASKFSSLHETIGSQKFQIQFRISSP